MLSEYSDKTPICVQNKLHQRADLLGTRAWWVKTYIDKFSGHRTRRVMAQNKGNLEPQVSPLDFPTKIISCIVEEIAIQDMATLALTRRR